MAMRVTRYTLKSVNVTIMLAIILSSLIVLPSATDYCHLENCKNGTRHTMCIYPTSPSDRCTGYQGSGLSDVEKLRILNLHNEYRQRVARGDERRGSPGPQPPAKYMPNLIWDDEITTIAQRWADQCTFGHDSCRNVDKFYVGQNVAAIGWRGSLKDPEVEAFVRMWYEEVGDFNWHEISKFGERDTNKTVGHYTQLIWAKTTHLGCGAVKYKSDQEWKKCMVVCNYKPGGNIKGAPIYEIP